MHHGSNPASRLAESAYLARLATRLADLANVAELQASYVEHKSAARAASSKEPALMHVPADHEMIAVVDRWAHHFGYHDNRIDLTNGDLSSFTTGDASLTAHAPLWGTKEGEEEAVPVAEVRRRLARLLRFARAHRHNLHLALHPDGTQLCLFFELKPRLRVLSIPLRTVTMAFVVLATETADGVRITAIHEWDAADPQAAAKVVINEHGWPADTTLNPHRGFGAAS